MRSPFRVESVQSSIGTKTLPASSLGFGAKPSQWGHPSRVMLRISGHSIGTKASSVHLSFVASRWGHPMGRVWFSSHSIETKSSLDSWSVFLQDGITLFGSDSTDLISIEGITIVGLLGEFFQPVLGVNFCHPGVVRSALKSGGVPHSVVFTSGADSVYPSRQRRSGSWPPFSFWPCCLSPSPRGSVCFGGLAVILFTRVFFMRGYSAHDSLLATLSGSRTSQLGVLACVQGASDSLLHPSPRCEAETSVFGIAVRVLLRATSLPHCMVSSPAPGRRMSVSAFKGCSSALRVFLF